MLFAEIPAFPPVGIEVVAPFPPHRIRAAFHDIDGTHSLIRDWVPVMTLVTGATAARGPFPGSPEAIAGQIAAYAQEAFPEAHRFAIESAGLSALTQMEWALRMARLRDGRNRAGNAAAIAAIWRGTECFAVPDESEVERDEIRDQAAELFRAYEILLRRMCRDVNLAAARRNPAAWRIPGSLEFLAYLRDHGVNNYFVTGAVVEYDADGAPRGTMYEEIGALGYAVGPNELIAGFRGSTWDEKLPKIELMRRLCNEFGIPPEELLIVGDGRSEIAAAVELGAMALSRLDRGADRARDIHRELGTNLIVERYDVTELRRIFHVCGNSRTRA